MSKEILLELKRSELLNKSRSSEKGRQRYNRRNKSSVMKSTREMNDIDMNSLFKDGILTVCLQVHGETSDYIVKIKFGDFLNRLHKILGSNGNFDIRNITRALVDCFNSENTYIHCSCPDFCLTSDTKIKLLSGEIVTIPEIISKLKNNEDIWVYSVDEKGDFKPGHVTDAFLSKYTDKTVIVTLDNGKTIECTPNHKFMMRDGSYKEAQELKVNESLMPLYFSYHISDIEYKTYDGPIPVYDISVDTYNNFYLDAGAIVHNCYRFNYWATRNDFDAGPEQHDNGKWIRNPNDKLGSSCKHVLLVLSNNRWIQTVARVIFNYVEYIRNHRENLYAKIIYPAIYQQKYEEPTQQNMFDDDSLDKDMIQTANDERRTSTQFKKGNQSGIQFAKEDDVDKNQLTLFGDTEDDIEEDNN